MLPSTAPHFPTRNTQQKEEGRTIREGQDNVRGAEQHEDAVPDQDRGHHALHTPHHSTGPPSKREGDVNTQTGRPVTQPPFTHHATHHPLCHPPSTTAPPTTTRGGGRAKDTPPHEHHRHTHTTHTPQDMARNSARHDSSTRQHCNGMSRARATPPHWAGQQQHTPPPFHTPRRMDTIHPSTHPLSLIHLHTTDDQR